MDANCFDGGGVDDGLGVREALLCSASIMDKAMLPRNCCPRPLLVSSGPPSRRFHMAESSVGVRADCRLLPLAEPGVGTDIGFAWRGGGE